MKLTTEFLKGIYGHMQSGTIYGSKNEAGMMVLTYSTSCTFKRCWDEYTRLCRGLIIDGNGEVLAHPFPKFFNLNEHPETQEKSLPWHMPTEVFDKLDGWLGISYRLDGKLCVSTRGSFSSKGALWATEHIQSGKYDTKIIPDYVTILFEIISPVTEIIVRYPYEKHGLHVIGAYNRITGKEYDREYIKAMAGAAGFPVVPCHGHLSVEDMEARLHRTKAEECEGYVIRFWNGIRVKIKSSDYKRVAELHKNMGPLSIWAVMKRGKMPERYRESWPNALLREYDKTVEALTGQYKKIWDECWAEFDSVKEHERSAPSTEGRKAFANRIKDNKYRSVLFALVDDDIDQADEIVHDMIRPKGNTILV
jgi:RNA ligase